MTTISYRESHSAIGHGAQYDAILYSAGAYDADVWLLEQAVLRDIIARHFPADSKHLDFACGTGRVLSFIRPHAASVTGLDVSAAMVAEARKKVPDARFVLGDATTDASVLPEPASFDSATAFRFFLNAEQPLREAGAAAIAGLLKPGAVFIFNNHGNRTSLLYPVLKVRQLLGLTVAISLPHRELMSLIARHGFEVIETRGVCFLPRIIARWVPRSVWRFLETTVSGIPALSRFGIYQIHVARRVGAR
jgi:SAM-dependent methyltransferase